MIFNNSEITKKIFTNGAILGFILVAVSVILSVFNIMPVGILIPFFLFIIYTALFYYFIHFTTKTVKNKYLEGYLSYGQGLLIGTLLVFAASIIYSIYGYIFNRFIDPGYIERLIDAQKEWFINFTERMKFPDETIESQIKMFDEQLKNRDDSGSVVGSIFLYTLFGFILSLISSAILKKNRDLFSSNFGNES